MVKILKFWQKTKPGFTQVINASDLLKPYQAKIDKILHLSQAPKQHFDNYYLYSIKKMAKLVQSLPASQAHHHAYKGGFLLHNLEVIEAALKKRNAILLPLGGTPEEQSKNKDLWSFGIFVASIMHDIGRLISDVDIFLFDKKYRELGRWSPFVGDMTCNKKVYYYQHHYNQSRHYHQHPLNSSILLSQIIHPVALDWLRQDSELWTMILMSIGNRKLEGGVISEIVKHADNYSVSESLKGTNIQTDTGDTIPKSLAENLLNTLKYLTLEVNPKMNSRGASIYTTDTDIYYVSERIIDDIKKQLRKDGQSGVPSDNARIMDEMVQFKVVVPNKENKAIWNITITDGGFKKPQSFTMLKVDINQIYPNSKARPRPFTGKIDIDKTGTDKDLPLPPGMVGGGNPSD